ncbi:hypothetical protein [Brachybacterium squillarum]|uniref:hypothetical protein n=1 Tax=Brachybacterium squillarum TaxID=661979 RepID=UPI00026299CB|nr:hypothetical protein [Brachybacterium squillarum]
MTSTSGYATAEESPTEEETSTPAPSAGSGSGSSNDGGPVVQLLNAITDDSGSGFGLLRQVLVAALGIGFLTAAGFIGATWRNRGPGA